MFTAHKNCAGFRLITIVPYKTITISHKIDKYPFYLTCLCQHKNNLTVCCNQQNVNRDHESKFLLSQSTICLSQTLVWFAMTTCFVTEWFRPPLSTVCVHPFTYATALSISSKLHWCNNIYDNFFAWQLRLMNISVCYFLIVMCNTTTVAPVRGVHTWGELNIERYDRKPINFANHMT